jgi:hypothetical protein
MKTLHPKVLCTLAATALVYAFLLAQPARADRAPTQEERSRIEQSLRALGFQSWGEIELDDGQWEIDDAQHEDGKKYELKLNLETSSSSKTERRALKRYTIRNCQTVSLSVAERRRLSFAILSGPACCPVKF